VPFLPSAVHGTSTVRHKNWAGFVDEVPFLSEMPYVGHQTACDFEVLERDGRGMLFGNSRSGRRAAIIMLALGSGLGAALIYETIVARSPAVRVPFGAGAVLCAVWSLWLLWRTLTRLELRTDRGEGKVTLRKRLPCSDWSVSWQLEASQVDHVILARGPAHRTVTLRLKDGHAVRLDEGVDIDALETLAKELADTLRCPIEQA